MVVHGHQRSPAVTDSSKKPQVARRSAQAAGTTRAGDSGCGPKVIERPGGRSGVARQGVSTVDIAARHSLATLSGGCCSGGDVPGLDQRDRLDSNPSIPAMTESQSMGLRQREQCKNMVHHLLP